MSDSDDTELLLLIPPDFYLLAESESESSFKSNIKESIKFSYQFVPSFDSIGNNIKEETLMASSYHYHLPVKQQNEIDKINEKINQVERNFTAVDSDISTTSNRTVKSFFAPIAPIKRSPYLPDKTETNLITSTPKYKDTYSNYSERFADDNGILQEIDKYLENKTKPTSSEYYYTNPSKNEYSLEEKLRNHSIHTNKNYSINQKNQNCQNPLISLNDLWDSQNIESSATNSTLTQLQEERLRRQHCEKTIQALQRKLLEYQQKISVALQVDKSKDNAICNLNEENSRIKDKLNNIEEQLKLTEHNFKEDNKKLQSEISELKSSKDCLEKELLQALNLAAKFQDKNEILEVKVEKFSKSTDEVKCLYSKQIEDMEIRLLNAQKSEEIANLELTKIQDLLAKSQFNEEKISKQVMMLENQIESFQKKAEQLEYVEDENRDLNSKVLKLAKREEELLKEVESQKNTLKNYYQNQLENVVEQKLIEFQSQLDSVEEALKTEAREREKTIAERAIKQLEMIIEKNEQEIILISQKHNEIVELYRIQLSNATKKIKELEELLTSFRTRRVDLAEKLHTVMETQWQKALEILTSPNDKDKKNQQNDHSKDKLDILSADSGITKPENETFDTPTSSRSRMQNRKHEQQDQRLQTYIDLLLNKSPRDLENLESILNMPKNTFRSSEETKQISSSQHSKPPWK